MAKAFRLDGAIVDLALVGNCPIRHALKESRRTVFGIDSTMRILVVEDEPQMAELVEGIVSKAGFSVDKVHTMAEAIEASRQRHYELILLDRRLPEGDALSRLREFRALRPSTRIVMLTALDALHDKVDGLDAGADDYITKPFQGEELVARVRACMRRPAGQELPALVVGSLSFDFRTLEVTNAGHPCVCSRRELMLLRALMLRVDRVTTREALIDEAFNLHDDVQANTLDTVVARLRRRLQNVGASVEIHTVRGVGYMLTASRR